ncbi:DUF2497 domain-containing protein [Rhizobium sp. LC145]|uniref:PopZ family protein n=1 Tax=Rhizobium sp. LC145 TaxID=1120688 RepID=UPI00062A119D|nr:DUF2497 domain-containing protein [Rhizobium sp. LC145]KKX25398.1 hypothetical protein YH62_26075 [Rhizobium sp. LC145]TKT46720.1 DUF2497 domain-containing protein [Rhizobiaceae bacterium LC148]
MAQPNVVREPSMEEILASIRRIIESNEPVGEGAFSGPLPPVYAEEEIEDAEEGVNYAPEMPANDPGEPRHRSMMGADEPAASAEKSMSLADVAARVRAASVRQQEIATARPASASAPLAPPPAAERPAPSAVARLLELRDAAASQPAPAVQPTRAPIAEPSAYQVQARMELEPEMQERRPEPRFASAPEQKSLPARIESAAGLISAEAGAQVARSFSELAAVFDGIERRSLEEMASEMLRPMLQEWLDDNLPTLVERLVREEIERVARGSRR